MKLHKGRWVAGSSLLIAATAAVGQAPQSTPATDESFALEEIVITARRRTESLLDVPQTVNAVTGADIARLNFRDFKDLTAVVPGLSMANNANGIGATASVRGVNYDVNASGNNGTVEFYMNDAPISAGNLFQTVYDIQQVELLRGPQGTLRGRASPSGSMTVTTRRPDLYDVGGYVSLTANDIGGYNGQGAIGVPIIEDKLAIRVAGAYEENEADRVKSLNSPIDPKVESKSGRATILFKPVDDVSMVLTYQNTQVDTRNFNQVESQQVLFPNAPVIPDALGNPPPFIRAKNRRAVHDAPRILDQHFENINFQFEWAFAGQKLNYVGARNEQHLRSQERGDIANFFPSNFPQGTVPPLTADEFQNFGQYTNSKARSYQHELRLSSEERLAGIFDYSVGAFYQEQKSPTSLSQATAILVPTGAPPAPVLGTVAQTPIQTDNGTEEISVFGHLTAHVNDKLELAGGLRYIEFTNKRALYIAGTRLAAADQDDTDDTVIWTASASYKFTDDFMAYVNVGTSWRPGAVAVGDFSLERTPLQHSFVEIDAEESISYEIGFKASALDNRLRASVAAYFQDFDNYPYRSASGVWYREVTPQGEQVRLFNFIAAVPVEVYGIEADVSFAPTPNWDMSLVAAVSKGEIKKGLIPCTDVNPRDGIPDIDPPPPALLSDPAAFFAASGNDNLSACTVTQRSSSAPQWSASLQSEYRVPITPAFDGYLRGLLTVYGNSKNDPTNLVDDYDGYELLNLYLGIRDPDGRWDLALYGKNVTKTEEVLTRSSSTLATNYRMITGVDPGTGQPIATPFSGQTNYYGGLAGNSAAGLTMTPPREFGVMFRYNFGSR